MIKLKKVQSTGLYILNGKSSANSSFIESKKEAREFIESANDRFAGYLKIKEYIVSQDSWTIVCVMEDEESIRSTYLKKREQTGREYKLPPLDKIWRIVSEQVRNFLSRFVKFCNFVRGRSGGLVHSNYERYYFESETEAMEFIEKIHDQSHDFGQKRGKYRPKKNHFKFGQKEKNGHIYLCSKNIKLMLDGLLEKIGSMDIWEVTIDVLREIVTSTKNLHPSLKNTIHYPKTE